MEQGPRIVVIGLGYVGLPLAVALAQHFDVIGLDISAERIAELAAHHDRTREVDGERLRATTLQLTEDPAAIRARDLYIVTVPTPVDDANRPDLKPLLAATRTVGAALAEECCPVVVFESTVYPGVTEEVCGPELARISGLAQGRGFRLGYSPERINPGDTVHTVDKITKVIAAEDGPTLDLLARVYGAINGGNVFRAASIKAAEAAKVIENAQRDINIAFMNELAQIFAKLDLSIWDVLAAARTKWNFLPFEPGLVGGHCIGVDPYYLAHRAQELGHHPQVVLAGRATNDGMGAWLADRLHERIGPERKPVLVLGLTFKENVPDLRNSRVIDIVRRLQWLGHQVDVADPLADPAEALSEYGLTLVAPGGRRYAMVIGAVAHDDFKSWDADRLAQLLEPEGVIADVKQLWDRTALGRQLPYWSL